MRPSSVAMPVATTTATASPRVRAVPLKRILLRSASCVSASMASHCFSTGIDSPVSTDSSTCRFCALTRRISVLTISPACTSRISPGTSSRAGIMRSRPARRTREVVSARVRSASIERTARSSITKPIAAFIAMTSPIAIASIWSPKANAVPAAATSSSTTRFWNWLTRICHALRGLAVFRRLAPKCWRRVSAWASVRPTSASTSSPLSTASGGVDQGVSGNCSAIIVGAVEGKENAVYLLEHGFIDIVAELLLGDRDDDGLGQLHIGVVADRQGDLVPDKREVFGVVIHGALKDKGVADLDDSAAIIVAGDPLADLHHGRLNAININDIALDAV